MTLSPGTHLGSYEILAHIGAGGMGKVYRAKDLKLGRDVAIKVLREELATDPERLRRFEQEARSASALNHPNIITIYDIGKHEDTPYIAMEFVEGKTLREVLTQGPLPTKKLLQLATQIAEGLAKAHSAGIVHRDLKPENLMVSSDEYVKILDFGLAKLWTSPSQTDSEAVTATREGTILGTVGYMSPEQARGKPADFRSDQFALGAIFYEMVTGQRAFHRESSVQTLSDIIEKEPEPINELKPEVPHHLRIIVDRCLAKGPEERYDSTRDLARELKSVEITAPSQPKVVSPDIHDEARPIHSLVVLPLTNLNPDPEQEYFSDGMTEALITDLARIGALKVISRTSAMRYKGTDKPLNQIAQELKVDTVLDGSVLKAGNRVRITAQLIKAETDEHLWAESYERDMQDVLLLQSEIARAVAQRVQVKLTPKDSTRLSRVQTVDPEVHQLYLKGRFFWAKFTSDSLTKSIELFQKAIEREPGYAPAYAGLADAYNIITFFGASAPREVAPKAKAAATKALALDETLPDAHATLGWIKGNYDWEWLDAEEHFQRALELNPGSSNVSVYYSSLLSLLGRHQEAIRETQRALVLDPLSVLDHVTLGRHLFFAGHYDQALQRLRQAVEMDPSYLYGWYLIGLTLLVQENYEEAIKAFQKAWPPSGEGDIRVKANIGYALALMGEKKQAMEKLNELDAASKKRYVPPTAIAFVHLALGNTDQFFQWLEKAYELHDSDLTYHLAFPFLGTLRHDPRYQDLRRRMNYPE